MAMVSKRYPQLTIRFSSQAQIARIERAARQDQRSVNAYVVHRLMPLVEAELADKGKRSQEVHPPPVGVEAEPRLAVS